MISEVRSKRFTTNLPPAHTVMPYPLTDPELPKLYPCACFCGGVSSGKTSQCCRLITKYIELGARDHATKKPVFQRCILFSPSIESNPVWSAIPEANLTKEDRISGYSDARIEELMGQIKLERKQCEEYKKEIKLYKMCLKSPDNLSKQTEDWLERLDYQPPEPRCQHPEGCIYHIILDDCLGQDCFKSQGKSAFTTFCLARRHMSSCIYICSQSIKQIPRRLRQSCSLYALFKYASADVLSKDFYPEVSNLLTEEDFRSLYLHAVKGRHDFLVIDLSQKPDRIFRRGWTHFISCRASSPSKMLE